MAVRAEVAGALLLGAAPDHHPGELLAHGDREPRVGLVVAVLDVEPGVELLDPGVLQLQRLDLGLDRRPLDAGGRGDHGRGARVQAADVLEVRRQPGPEVLGLADVDDPAARVPEPVDARLGRDGPGLGPVGQGGARHASTLRSGGDAAGTGLVGPGQASEIWPPLTVTSTSPSGAVAGPPWTEPSSMENLLPWHGQLIVPSATDETGQPWWVQIAEKPLNSPSAGCVTTTFSSLKTCLPRRGCRRRRPGRRPRTRRRRTGTRTADSEDRRPRTRRPDAESVAVLAGVAAAGGEERKPDPHGGGSGERVASAECFLGHDGAPLLPGWLNVHPTQRGLRRNVSRMRVP